MSLLAEVTEAGDIVLYTFLLGIALVVGLALLAVDTLVGRRQRRRGRSRPG